MKKYVVNLADSPERLRSTKKVLEGTPLGDFERFEAFDARPLAEDRLKQIFDYEGFYRRHRRYPRAGEIGCAKSHVALWRQIADDGQTAVIMEDDITLLGNITGSEVEAFERLLGNDRPAVLMLSDSNICIKSSVREIDVRTGSGKDVRLNIAKPVVCECTCSYILNPAGAHKLLEIWKDDTVCDDWIRFADKGLDVLVHVPAVISNRESDFESTIAKTQADRHDTDFTLAERAVLKARNLWERLMLRLGIWVRV